MFTQRLYKPVIVHLMCVSALVTKLPQITLPESISDLPAGLTVMNHWQPGWLGWSMFFPMLQA